MSTTGSGSTEAAFLRDVPTLDLRDFFDAYDKGDPYHVSAVSELHSELMRFAPHLLSRESSWFQNWQWGGKRDLLTGLKVRDGKFIYPS